MPAAPVQRHCNFQTRCRPLTILYVAEDAKEDAKSCRLKSTLDTLGHNVRCGRNKNIEDVRRCLPWTTIVRSHVHEGSGRSQHRCLVAAYADSRLKLCIGTLSPHLCSAQPTTAVCSGQPSYQWHAGCEIIGNPTVSACMMLHGQNKLMLTEGGLVKPLHVLESVDAVPAWLIANADRGTYVFFMRASAMQWEPDMGPQSREL